MAFVDMMMPKDTDSFSHEGYRVGCSKIAHHIFGMNVVEQAKVKGCPYSRTKQHQTRIRLHSRDIE